MYKVLVTARVFKQDDELFSILRDNGCEVVPNPCYGRILTEEEMIENLQGVDGIILGLEKMNSNVIAHTDSLKVISRFGVGYDNVDVLTATEKGIIVTNVRGQNSESVAELTMCLMIAISRKVPAGWNMVKDGLWSIINGNELKDKTLGIVGLGNIGKVVAQKAKAFNMKVLVYDRSAAKKAAYCEENGIEIAASKEDLFARADYVSLHAPATAEMKNFVGTRELELMKPTAYLINMARGSLVDEEALYAALKEKKIAGAALDDVTTPPLEKGSKLASLDNVIITPHMGANTFEANYRTKLTTIANVIDGVNGKLNENVVNREGLEVRNK